MNCDACGQPATIRDMQIVGGKPRERHFCQKCAAKHGLDAEATALAIVHTKTQIVITPGQVSQVGTPVRTVTGVPSCAGCGMTYGNFRQHGLLGCARCYAAFGEALGALLERAAGATHHVGKIPRRTAHAPGTGGVGEAPARGRLAARTGSDALSAAPAVVVMEAVERKRREEILRRQMGEAVAAEQYERAACLRDEIRRLEESVQVTPGHGGKSGAVAGPMPGSPAAKGPGQGPGAQGSGA